MRSSADLLNDPNYDPDRLLNEVMARLCLKNDAALSRTLGITPPTLSKVRHRRLAVAAGLMIQIHDATKMSLDDVRLLLGVAVPAMPKRAAELPLPWPMATD